MVILTIILYLLIIYGAVKLFRRKGNGKPARKTFREMIKEYWKDLDDYEMDYGSLSMKKRK